MVRLGAVDSIAGGQIHMPFIVGMTVAGTISLNGLGEGVDRLLSWFAASVKNGTYTLPEGQIRIEDVRVMPMFGSEEMPPKTPKQRRKMAKRHKPVGKKGRGKHGC